MNDPQVNLKEAIRNLDSLPTMPVVAQKILCLPLDTHDGEMKLLQLIRHDPLISVRIIGLANSPLFGASRKVTSIQDAAMILGINRVKSVSVGIAVMSALTRRPTGHLNMQHLWLHSLGMALAMCALANAMPAHLRPPEEEIFLAGLLHDIGFMVLNYIDPARSDLLQSRLEAEPGRPINDIEAEIIEISHCELGAELARHWDMPDNIVAVLRYHHTPANTTATDGQHLIALLTLVEKLIPGFGIPEYVADDICENDWLVLGIDPAHNTELAETVCKHAEQAFYVVTPF
jgi:putative nucleotidyltransferase with HDIG domain